MTTRSKSILENSHSKQAPHFELLSSSKLGSRSSSRNSNDSQMLSYGRRASLKSKLSGHLYRNDTFRLMGGHGKANDPKPGEKESIINGGKNEQDFRRHKIRFWRNKKDKSEGNTYDDFFKDRKSDCCSFTSSKSTKVNSVISSEGYISGEAPTNKDDEKTASLKKHSKHHIRRWLNEETADGSLLLKSTHANVTTRIIKARHAIGLAAENTARMASIRIQAQAVAFTGAVTTAAFGRVKAAERDPSASHGSIANAAMYAAREVARALINSNTSEEDLAKLNEIFQKHFEFKGPEYFKRLRPISIQESNKKTAAYRMYYKMKRIPNPPIGADPLEYYLKRSTEREMKRQKIEDVDLQRKDEAEKHEKLDAENKHAEVNARTRISTAKSAFWSFIGIEAESTKKSDYDNISETCSQKGEARTGYYLREIFGKPSEENKKSEEDNASMTSSKSTFWSFISGSNC